MNVQPSTLAPVVHSGRGRWARDFHQRIRVADSVVAVVLHMRTARLLFANLAAVALLVSLVWGGAARATPIPINETYSSSDGAATLNLHGDLNGTTLTLNSAAPKSQLLISPSAETFSAGTYQREVPCAAAADCGTVTAHIPNISVDAPTWAFDLTGSADFQAATGSLSGAVVPPPTAYFTQASVIPTFTGTVNPNLGYLKKSLAGPQLDAIVTGLNDANPTLNVYDSYTWNSFGVSVTDASKMPTPDGSETKYHLGGTFDFSQTLGTASANVTFGSSLGAANDVGDLFATGISGTVNSYVAQYYRGQLPHAEAGMLNDLGGTASCTDTGCSSQFALDFFAAAPVANAPEPPNLAIFAFGLAGLGFMRRHRRTA